MKKNTWPVLAFAFLFFLGQGAAHAYWVWSPDQGKFVNPDGANQDSAEEQYDYAMQFYKDRNLDEALKQLEAIIKKYPAARIASEAEYRRATVYEEKGDYWKAFHVYKELVESYPHSERVDEVMEREFKIGNLFFSGKKGRWMGLEILPSLPRAAQIFEHIVATSPYGRYGDEAQFRLGLTYKKSGQFSKAMEAFQYLIEQYPNSQFLPEARYQMAETSFLNSAAQFRDERALDQASSAVDRFLSREGSTEEAEKAAKLRQAIDEKNAEKNFRIGIYYEKEKYLDSALIYYGDVAKRYPDTQWGAKAAERIKALKQPVDFIKGQQLAIDKDLAEARRKLQDAGGKDAVEKGMLKREVERLEQKQKSIEKSKHESIAARREDLGRREQELKERFQKLKEKQKLLIKNPSDDLKRALDRWSASLEADKVRLQDERHQLQAWQSQLGIKERQFSLGMLPFIGGGEVSALDKVRRVEAKKYYEISGAKKNLLSEKELLYKQYGEVLTLLGAEPLPLTMPLASMPAEPGVVAQARRDLTRLEKELAQKEQAYEGQFGKKQGSWMGTSARVMVKSLDVLNPFDGGKENLGRKNLQELLERRMHLRERLSAQQALVDTLSQAFNSQLAVQEQKRLLQELESRQQGRAKEDIMELRHSVKALERKVRRGYQEIEERHQHKRELLKQLDALLGNASASGPALSRTVKLVGAPAVGVLELSRAFLFGRRHEDVKLTQSARQEGPAGTSSVEVTKLKEALELESLLIEDQYEKITKQQRELETLKARASLAGGFKFRTALVQVPYGFIREAVESADRLVPRKDREEVLIHMMDKETRQLEALKQEQSELEAWIGKKEPSPAAAPAKPMASAQETQSQETEMRTEIQSLSGKVEAKKADLQRDETKITEKTPQTPEVQKKSEKEKAAKAAGAGGPSGKAQRKLRSELNKVEKSITRLIRKERKLDQTEFSILEKRMHKI